MKQKITNFVWEEQKPKPEPTKLVKPEAEQRTPQGEKKMELDSAPAPINDLFLRLGIGPSKGLLPTERVERVYVSRLQGAAPQVRDGSSTGEESEEAQAARWAAEEEAIKARRRRVARR